MIAVLTLALVFCGCGRPAGADVPSDAAEDTIVAITEPVTQPQTTVTQTSGKSTGSDTKSSETVKTTDNTRESTAKPKETTRVTDAETDSEDTDTDETSAPETKFAPITGEYQGVYAVNGTKHATIELVPDLDGTYDVRINWTNSETDTFAWTFDGTFEDGKLEYDNAIKTHIVFDEYDRSSTETMYSGGKGSIEVKEGVLTWNDGEEHIADGLRFKAE